MSPKIVSMFVMLLAFCCCNAAFGQCASCAQSAPSYSQSSYAAPVYAPVAPVYRQSYSPVYSSPVSRQPVLSRPVLSRPVFNSPVRRFILRRRGC